MAEAPMRVETNTCWNLDDLVAFTEAAINKTRIVVAEGISCLIFLTWRPCRKGGEFATTGGWRDQKALGQLAFVYLRSPQQAPEGVPIEQVGTGTKIAAAAKVSLAKAICGALNKCYIESDQLPACLWAQTLQLRASRKAGFSPTLVRSQIVALEVEQAIRQQTFKQASDRAERRLAKLRSKLDKYRGG